jgi:hypothetical protein
MQFVIASSGSGRRNHAGQGSDDSGGGPYLSPDDQYNQRREIAVDPLQILGLSNFDETDDRDSE